MPDIYGFKPHGSDGAPVDLADYRGKVLLIVNTASKCGFTPQYEGLEDLWRRHKDQGLVVLGFPCNQFGAQEPGNAAEIANFCSLTYDVTFPVLAKVDVNGPKADPVFAFLKTAKRGVLGSSSIKWNFTKFLIGRDGKILSRFGPTITPSALEGAVVAALAHT